jgi:hypothetical protein
MSPERRWYSVAEAAAHFQLMPKTLYSLIGRDRLPVGAILRIGRAIRIDVKAIEADAALSGRGKGRR